MFGLFKKKTQKEQLEETYEKLLKESFKLSTINRTASDAKAAEADPDQSSTTGGAWSRAANTKSRQGTVCLIFRRNRRWATGILSEKSSNKACSVLLLFETPKKASSAGKSVDMAPEGPGRDKGSSENSPSNITASNPLMKGRNLA